MGQRALQSPVLWLFLTCHSNFAKNRPFSLNILPFFVLSLPTLFACRVFVVNIMIPGPPYLSFVAYLEGDKVRNLTYFLFPHELSNTLYPILYTHTQRACYRVQSPRLYLLCLDSSSNVSVSLCLPLLIYIAPLALSPHPLQNHRYILLISPFLSPSQIVRSILSFLSPQSKFEEDTPFGRVARPFFNGNDDEFRNNRFKLIPKVRGESVTEWLSF